MAIREIEASLITRKIAEICTKANFELGQDALMALKQSCETEVSPLGRQALSILIENASIAREEKIPLCQDCGTAVIFVELGQDVHISGGEFNTAVLEGVRQGYCEGYLRKSMVKNPFGKRENTRDNTPPVVHCEIVPGSELKIMVLPKGGGAENMSRIAMLKPGDGIEEISELVVETVRQAGGAPCPPLVIGVGIGATFEKAAMMAKKVLGRKLDEPNPDTSLVEFEQHVLERVNRLGIGPLGTGGSTTALRVHAASYPCHIASLPVAVNLQCHSCRHAEVVI